MTTPTDYPLPSHAAYIWTNGDKIMLTFPGYEGVENRRFNTVTLDPTDTPKCKCGCYVRSPVLMTLFEVLKERSNSARTTSSARKISNPATPTQAQIDEALAKAKQRRIDAKMKKAEEILLKLGLIEPE